MPSVVHLVGIDITVEGRWIRQRCSWCGVALIDADLSNVMVPEGQARGYPTWKIGTWLRMDEGCPTVYSIVEPPGDERYPAGSCFNDVVPVVKLAGQGEGGNG